MTDMLQRSLDNIDRKLDKLDSNSRETTTAVAVLTERVGNLIEKTEEHIAHDRTTHDRFEKQIGGLDKWRTELKTKIATYAAIAGVIVSFTVSIVKEAIAAAFQ